MSEGEENSGYELSQHWEACFQQTTSIFSLPKSRVE